MLDPSSSKGVIPVETEDFLFNRKFKKPQRSLPYFHDHLDMDGLQGPELATFRYDKMNLQRSEMT